MISQSNSTPGHKHKSGCPAQIALIASGTSQLKIISFNIWDLPYWFVKNRKQRILQIAEYLLRLDAEIIYAGSFDVLHRQIIV